MTLEDAKLERLVRSTVGAELDAQRGRALAAFRNGSQKPEAGSQKNHHRWMQWWAGGASAIAACLAVVLTAQLVAQPKVVPAVGGDTAVAKGGVPVMDQVTLTRNVDGGTVVLDDGSPARLVRQQTLRKTQWFDPREKATYSVTEPVEKVGYVKVRPY